MRIFGSQLKNKQENRYLMYKDKLDLEILEGLRWTVGAAITVEQLIDSIMKSANCSKDDAGQCIAALHKEELISLQSYPEGSKTLVVEITKDSLQLLRRRNSEQVRNDILKSIYLQMLTAK